MLISVAICTWNRSHLLDQTLSAMKCLIIPDGIEWELIVVNNNCTDDTDAIIGKHSDVLPIKRIFEQKQGLSNARNAAVAVAQGDYIVWTDDDVIVDEGWLVAYVRAFALHPEASFFGGPVEPWFEGSPPSWIEDSWSDISDAFAVRDLGPTPFLFDLQRLPYGANFAVRKSDQEKHFFDPRFGLSKGVILLGEETHLMKSLLKGGAIGWWVPDAHVQHWIPKARQQVDYIRKYFFGYGRTIARQSDIFCSSWYRKPKWMWRKAILAGIWYVVFRLLNSPKKWAGFLKESSMYWGMIFSK